MPAVPWLLLAENTTDNPDHFRKIYSLNYDKCYQLSLPETFAKRCRGSVYGWVAMVDRDFNVELFNPLTKAHIPFPSLKTALVPPPEYDEEWDESIENYIVKCLAGIFVGKLIVLKVSKPRGHHEFIIMLLYDWRKSVAFARQGDKSWTPVFIKEKKGSFHEFVDVIGMDDCAFASYGDGSIVYLDFKETPPECAIVNDGW